MLNITITQDLTTVWNTSINHPWTLKTPEFFGDVFATLEKKFPDFDFDHFGDKVIAHVVNRFTGQKDKESHWLFGCTEIGSTFYALLSYINERTVLTPTLKEIEELRISNLMGVTFLPVGISAKEGMKFENLSNPTQVLIASLYYCAYNDLKLVRCKHCGRWFATKTLKEEFCSRISPCYNMVVAGKKVLGSERTCKDAVVIIKQRLRDRKKKIYNGWATTGEFEKTRPLCDRFAEFMDKIKESPTPGNIVACMEYLYSDDMPKQKRPNRKSNRIKEEKYNG